jgi:hypothetical protein
MRPHFLFQKIHLPNFQRTFAGPLSVFPSEKGKKPQALSIWLAKYFVATGIFGVHV